MTLAEIARIVAKVDRRMNAAPKKSAFDRWLDTLIEEKGYDLEAILEIPGKSGTNFMPLSVVANAIKSAPKHEQNAIKTMIVKIDFVNASVLDYFKHLAQALAI